MFNNKSDLIRKAIIVVLGHNQIRLDQNTISSQIEFKSNRDNNKYINHRIDEIYYTKLFEIQNFISKGK